jgi:prophage antirepressor-like protein
MKTAMNKLIPFGHPVFGEVRALLDERGSPWLSAADVCRTLGMSDVIHGTAFLGEPDKRILVTCLRAGVMRTTIISRGGLDRLVGACTWRPDAADYRRWIHDAVYPAILDKATRSAATPAFDGWKTPEQLAADLSRILRRQVTAGAVNEILTREGLHGDQDMWGGHSQPVRNWIGDLLGYRYAPWRVLPVLLSRCGGFRLVPSRERAAG